MRRVVATTAPGSASVSSSSPSCSSSTSCRSAARRCRVALSPAIASARRTGCSPGPALMAPPCIETIRLDCETTNDTCHQRCATRFASSCCAASATPSRRQPRRVGRHRGRRDTSSTFYRPPGGTLRVFRDRPLETVPRSFAQKPGNQKFFWVSFDSSSEFKQSKKSKNAPEIAQSDRGRTLTEVA